MGTRSGELAMRPLPAVLLDLHEDLATGKLVLRRGRITKVIDLVNGNPVSSTSSSRDETLGHFLVNSGVIDEAQHREAVRRASEEHTKLGEALVHMGVLTLEALVEQLGRQARHKIVQALRWPQGAWRFDDGPAVEGIQLRMVEVVLGGLRETAVELDRLARLDAHTYELTARGQQLRPELKRTFGGAAVAKLAEGAPMVELEKMFTDRAQARIGIDAMLLCDAAIARLDAVGLGAGGTQPGEPITNAGDEPSEPSNPSHPFGRTLTRPRVAGSALFDLLFEDVGGTEAGAAPLDFIGDDSGIVAIADVLAANTGRELTATTRQMLAAEERRVRAADHYAVLMVPRRATANEIESSHATRTLLLDRDTHGVSNPHDKQRVDTIRAAYDEAKRILLDEHRRAAYDRELAGGELVQVAPAIDTELSFRIAEELMAKRQWAQAIGHIKTVLAQAPHEADYHAALGWSEWMAAGDRSAETAERAKEHLNAALAINPDHAAAHDYLGRIAAGFGGHDDAESTGETRRPQHALGDDSEALFHLERALDLDPTRVAATRAIERLLVARGELRRLERVFKRLIFRLRGRGTIEAKAWARLARLYREHLDDLPAADAATGHARRIAPRDSDVAALITPEPRALGPQPRTAETSHPDAAFLVAASRVGLGTADATMTRLYEAGRGRGSAAPVRPLDRAQWNLLRHPDDTLELGALLELAAPAVHALSPMTRADAELDDALQLSTADLPAPFARLRARCAAVLGVTPAPVFPRVELGAQIHVVATDPPVLVAGDEALTAPERPELVFRLARAMTFLWPGRAVGASRPGRILRAIVMAIFREASDSPIGADEPLAPAADRAIAVLDPAARAQAHAAALRIMSRGAGLNLSAWARALARTADRAGLLLCGDVPTAFAGAREAGGDLDRDLVEFSYSAAHVTLRQQLGMGQ